MNYKPLNVTVTTFDGDETDSERAINLADPLHKKWLDKHLYWAMHNGKAVEVAPQEVE